MVPLKLLFFLLTIEYLSPVEAVRSSFDDCSVEKKSCKIDQENLISSIPVDNIEQCRHLCVETENCQYLSFYGSTNYPLWFVYFSA